MKILTCYKLVPEEQDISVKTDGTVDTSKAESKISPFDLNAIEAAVQLAAQITDSTVTALSVGGKALENTKARKDVLSRGPDALNVLIDEQLDSALPHVTARALACAAQKIGYDLIICGDGSGDLYAQQTGLLLGEILGIPTINAVSNIVGAQDGKLTVERTLEDEVEVLSLPLPAVISVTADINVPKIPAMKAILAAAKKPVTVFNSEDINLQASPALVELVAVKAPQQKERQQVMIEGDGDDQIATLADFLRKALN